VWGVTIGSASPPIPPVPPTPPPVPSGLWGLTTVSHTEARKLDSRVLVYVSPMADNYAAVAELILTKQITGVESAKTELRKRNRAMVPEAERQYWAGWNTAIATIMQSHNTELRADINLVAEAYAAISDGLSLTGRRTR